MIGPEKINQLKDFFESSQSIFIMFSPSATVDHLAVSTSLYVVLQAAGKDVRLLSPRLPESAQLAGLDQTSTEIGNQNLSISFDYNEESVDKVSYHIGEETGKFYLTIKPKKGHQPLDTASVELSYTGAETDLLILVGVQRLEDLEQLYYGYEDVFTRTGVITIDKFEPPFGTLSIDLSSSASLSEEVAQLLLNLGYDVNSEAATNLLSGIEHATNRLQSMTATAQTFETIAQLMNMGARRLRPVTGEPRQVPEGAPAVGAGASAGASTGPVETTFTVTPHSVKPPQPVRAPQPVQAPQTAQAPQSMPPRLSQPPQQPKKNKQKKNFQPHPDNRNEKQAVKAGDLKYQPSGFSPRGS